MICSTYRQLAFFTWDLLRKGRAVQYQIGEETITDLVVLQLKTRLPKQVITKTYTKPEEGQTGADWEWWLSGPSGAWMGFRVQAKVIELATDSYPHLHYSKTVQAANGQKLRAYQCDTLIRHALNSSPRCAPLYCMFTHWQGQQSAPWSCGSFSRIDESYGCMLTSPFVVRHLRSQGLRRGLVDLLPHSFPWHCLVCCQGYSDPGADLPHRALSYWQQQIQSMDLELLGPAASADDPDVIELLDVYSEIGLTREPPSYVQSLLLNEPSEPPQDVRAVTVIIEEHPPTV